MADLEVNRAALKDIDKQLAIALEQTADQMLTDLITAQLMPFDTGNMQNGQTAVDASNLANKEVTIITSAPQARRLYFHPEYNFKKSQNANAGGRWWDDYISGSKKDFAGETFKKLAKRRLAKYDN